MVTALATDGPYLVVGDELGVVARCNVPAPECWPHALMPLPLAGAHTAPVAVLRCLVSLDVVFSAATDGRCFLHTLAAGEFLLELDLAGYHKRASSDGDNEPVEGEAMAATVPSGTATDEAEGITGSTGGTGGKTLEDALLMDDEVTIHVHDAAISAGGGGLVAVEVVFSGAGGDPEERWVQLWAVTGAPLARVRVSAGADLEDPLVGLHFFCLPSKDDAQKRSVSNEPAEGPAASTSSSTGGVMLLTVGRASAQIREMASLRVVCNLHVPPLFELGGGLSCAYVTPEGGNILAGSLNGLVLIYDIELQ
jgi:hypothetical protein